MRKGTVQMIQVAAVMTAAVCALMLALSGEANGEADCNTDVAPRASVE